MKFMFKKKLKKISYDLVSYIQIETEAIKDFNDKQMISSYCLHNSRSAARNEFGNVPKDVIRSSGPDDFLRSWGVQKKTQILL